jgi:hypothetical protein
MVWFGALGHFCFKSERGALVVSLAYSLFCYFLVLKSDDSFQGTRCRNTKEAKSSKHHLDTIGAIGVICKRGKTIELWTLLLLTHRRTRFTFSLIRWIDIGPSIFLWIIIPLNILGIYLIAISYRILSVVKFKWIFSFTFPFSFRFARHLPFTNEIVGILRHAVNGINGTKQ